MGLIGSGSMSIAWIPRIILRGIAAVTSTDCCENWRWKNCCWRRPSRGADDDDDGASDGNGYAADGRSLALMRDSTCKCCWSIARTYGRDGSAVDAVGTGAVATGAVDLPKHVRTARPVRRHVR